MKYEYKRLFGIESANRYGQLGWRLVCTEHDKAYACTVYIMERIIDEMLVK